MYEFFRLWFEDYGICYLETHPVYLRCLSDGQTFEVATLCVAGSDRWAMMSSCPRGVGVEEHLSCPQSSCGRRRRRRPRLKSHWGWEPPHRAKAHQRGFCQVFCRPLFLAYTWPVRGHARPHGRTDACPHILPSTCQRFAYATNLWRG